MAFDRSKFKATAISTLKEQEAENKSANMNNAQDGKIPFHQIPEGTSKWRIMPAHPECKSYMAAKQVHWLPQEVTYEKDGKEVTEIKRRPIFNSRTHGNTSKDIVEEYIAFVTKLVYDEVQDPEERKKKLFNLTDWKTGVKGRLTWITYAQRIEGNARTLGRLELPSLVKDKMNELAITDDTSDDVIQTDPFTDPDTGKAILITYDKSQKEPAKKYGATLEWRGNYSLNDEELEAFMEADTLESIYKESYKRKDFEKALAGLRIFDEDNRYNAFGHDEWLDICEQIDKFYPENDEAEEEEKPTPKSTKTTKTAHVAKEVVAEVSTKKGGDLPWEDEYDDMDRAALKTFITENELDIRVLPKYSDDQIRDMIREEMENATNPQRQVVDEIEEAEEAEEVEAAPAASGSASDRVAAMKARLGKK